MNQQIGKADSAVKAELDRLELVERVPMLTRASGRVLPRHPALVAFARECATRQHPDADLKTARRNYEAASVNYNNRCAFRSQPAIYWTDGGKFICLSAIIEARADALHWRKIVLGLETAKKLEQQKRWDDARSHVTAI